MKTKSEQRDRVVMVGLIVGLVATVLSGTSAGIARAEGTARQPLPQPVGSLAVGESLFWDGDLHVDRIAGGNFPYGLLAFGDNAAQPETCNNPEPCWAYEIDVTENADRLRVWMDVNDRSECVWFELWAPGTYGDPNATRTQLGEVSCNDYLPIFPMLWDLEANIANPEPGTWIVRVVPFQVENWGFRMRATLENASQSGANGLLPDLKTLPAYDFGFEAPISPGAGAVSDNTNPPGRVLSCTPDEIEEANKETGEAPLRCLRFSAGIYNVGQGLLDLRLREEGRVVQMIRNGAGAVTEEHEAGGWEPGGTHLHNHLKGFADFELFKIVNIPTHPDPNEDEYLEHAGSGHKLGWHDADQRLYDWYRFDPWVQLAEFRHCRDVEQEECISVSPGWGDHYRWSRPGMYVDFPFDIAGSADGDYVVRMTVDRPDNINESDERNNTSYAWIRVAGNQVTICERGLGTSPWDPRKELHEPNFWLSTPGGTTADSPTGDCS